MRAPWYNSYDSLSAQVYERRSAFRERCRGIGADEVQAEHEIWNELVARAVRESNWQEGLLLSEPRTQELVNEAIHSLSDLGDARLDITAFLNEHRRRVRSMLFGNLTPEEIGAYNLGAAYNVLPVIIAEFRMRMTAGVAQLMEQMARRVGTLHGGAGERMNRTMEEAKKVISAFKSGKAPQTLPLVKRFKTEGEYVRSLLREQSDSLLHPLPESYIHFLHRLTLAGLYPAIQTGRYRKVPVHVGLREVMFPAPSLVPGMMREYCTKFPTVLGNEEEFDAIIAAASASYGFVSIHPYSDGNGRVSRLLMNLVLRAYRFPPVYLKADKKGRHRYAQALRRANTGQIRPLGCLIAYSLVEIYDRLLKTLQS